MPWAEFQHFLTIKLVFCQHDIGSTQGLSFAWKSWSPHVLSHPPCRLKKCKEAKVREHSFWKSVVAGLLQLGGALLLQAASDSILSAAYHSSVVIKADTSDIWDVRKGPVHRRGRRRCCCELGWRTQGSPCTEHTRDPVLTALNATENPDLKLLSL